MSYDDNPITRSIIGAAINVHSQLGPGFLESIYRNAMNIELSKFGFDVKTEHAVKVLYDGQEVGLHRIDLFVNDDVVVELKTVEEISKAHYAQTRSYMHAIGTRLGLLINFSGSKADWRRVDP